MFLFLDIDGVMVPAKNWKSPELLEDGFPVFSSKAVFVLQQIITEDTTIMLTTSHKSRFTINEWKLIFEKRGVKISKLKCLDNNTQNLSRKDEVLNWVNRNKLKEDFIIIDDDKSLNELPPFLKEKLVLTSSLVGLSENHLEEIESILGKKRFTVSITS